MLGNFEDQGAVLLLDLQGREDRRQFSLKLHIDDGADYLVNPSHKIAGHAQTSLGLSVTWCHKTSFQQRRALQRLGTGYDFNQFLGDDGLTRAVVG